MGIVGVGEGFEGGAVLVREERDSAVCCRREERLGIEVVSEEEVVVSVREGAG